MGEVNNDITVDLSSTLDENSANLLMNFAKTADLIEEVFENYYKKYELSKPQFNAIYAIFKAGDEGITLSSLGSKMFVTRANITTLVDRIEARGLIQRIINPNDRRSIKAVITKDGKKLIDTILPTHQIFSSKILGFLTESEKKRCDELLTRIQRELIDNYLKD